MMSFVFFAYNIFSIPLPKWPKEYHLKGTWNIPYWQIRQPFEVDTCRGKGFQSEIAYNGIAQNIHYLKQRKYTIQTSPAGLTCSFTDLDPNAPDSLIEYLPSGDDWVYIGERIVLGRETHAWRRDDKSKGWYYIFYADKVSLNPVRYFQHGGSIRHSHPAEYIFDIEDFGPTANHSTFTIPTDTCRNMSSGGPTKNLKYAHDISKPIRSVKQDYCSILEPEQTIEIPKEFSWRQVKGVVPTVRDQSNCGSCWAQSAVEAISSQFSIHKKGNVSISVQQVIDCVWAPTTMACAGGEGFDAYEILKRDRILLSTEEEYPYLGVSGYCQSTFDNPIGYVTGCHQVKPSDYNSLKRALYKYGPLMIYVKSGFDEFVAYKGGVFNNPKCHVTIDQLDHGVLLTGWKIIDGVETFEIMNSWSTMWGDQGFAYIASGDNDCGVSLMALLPKVELYNK